jgi:hypothetical protein
VLLLVLVWGSRGVVVVEAGAEGGVHGLVPPEGEEGVLLVYVCMYVWKRSEKN